MKIKTISLEQFIKRQKITMKAEPTAKNPYMPDMPRNFKCTLLRLDKFMNLHFSQGSAHTQPPTIEDVLDCLASDCSSYENAKDFEDWAEDFGANPDSRKMEKTYRTIGEQRDELKTFLGDAYEQLLYNTERM